MTNTYNTGNALGSTDPRDLLDNASNLDDGMNSALPTFVDRLGVSRDTWAGMENTFDLSQSGREAAFQQFLADSGFVSLGNYTSGLVFTRYNEYLAYGGFFYRPAPNSIPFTTTGTWVGADEDLFVLFSQDDVLRQDLANPDKGAAMVGGAAIRVSTIEDLASIPENTRAKRVVACVSGYRASGDGGHGSFIFDSGNRAADVASDPMRGLFVAPSGEDGSQGCWVRLHDGNVSVAWFGASVSEVDNAPYINAAIDLCSPRRYKVLVPSGTFESTQIVLRDWSWLEGEGQDRTIIKMKAGTNDHLVMAANSKALWGTGSVDAVENPVVIGMTLDGNFDENTTGDCLALYASRPVVEQVTIMNAPGNGMRTEYGVPASGLIYGPEGMFGNISIVRTKGHNWQFAGPHDSHARDVILINASMGMSGTYDNLFIERYQARWTRVHAYSYFDMHPIRVRSALRIAAVSGGNEFSQCHFEGANTNVYILGTQNVFDDTCRFYFPWGGINVALSGHGNTLRGQFGSEYLGIGLQRATGVLIADGASGNHIDIIGENQHRGLIDFVNSGGANRVKARGYNPDVGSIAVAGSPAASDTINVSVSGPEYGLYEQGGGYSNTRVGDVDATGSAIADASQIGPGIQNIVIRTGGANTCVRLPSVAMLRDGAEIRVFNATVSAKKVFPYLGQQFLGYGYEGAFTLPPLGAASFVVISASVGELMVLSEAAIG